MPLWQEGLQMATHKLPKVIKPRPHAMIDYAVAGSFMLMGALWWRRNKRAAIGSLICGGATAVNSLLTDYPGGMFRVISYRNHGRIDLGIVGLAAAMPRTMNFRNEPEARSFGLRALGQAAIAGLTDFDYYEHPLSRWLRHEEDEPAA
jgi:hypothetical protein